MRTASSGQCRAGKGACYRLQGLASAAASQLCLQQVVSLQMTNCAPLADSEGAPVSLCQLKGNGGIRLVMNLSSGHIN